jgi:hypothetical protein
MSSQEEKTDFDIEGKLEELVKKYVNQYITDIKDSLLLQLIGHLESQKSQYESTYGCESFDKVEQKHFKDDFVNQKEKVVHDIGGNELRIIEEEDERKKIIGC